MEHTQLAGLYAQGAWKPLAMKEAVALSCDFLERLPPDCIIYRIGGNGHPLHAIAPKWVWQKKQQVIEEINCEFERRQTKQGSLA
jgi:hypothetical protein